MLSGRGLHILIGYIALSQGLLIVLGQAHQKPMPGVYEHDGVHGNTEVQL